MRLKCFLFLNLFVAFVALTNSACIKQKASQASSSPDVEANTTAVDKEIADALKLIEKMPDSPRGYNNLAVVYIRKARETGDFSLNAKAETAVSRALEINSADASAQKLQASLHLSFHRFGEALELGAKLEREFPGDAFVYGILADANVELGRYPEAIDAAQKMVDLKPNTASYARVAHLRSLHGDHQGAVEMFKLAARTADPLDKEAQSWCLAQLGDELWKYGRYEQAEKVYTEALQNFPQFHPAIAGKGRIRAAQGDFAGAVKFLTDANQRVPNVETAILLGDIYAKQNNEEKAGQLYDLVEILEQKIGINNDRKRLALLWADQNIRLDEALEIVRREREMRKDIFTADALAWVLYKKGEFREAKKAADEAMRLKTQNALFYYHAGMIENALGNEKEAVRFLKLALETNPAFDLIQADAARQTLQNLQRDS